MIEDIRRLGLVPRSIDYRLFSPLF